MDACEDILGWTVGVDHSNPVRLALGKFEEALPNPAVKLGRLVIEPALARRGFRVTAVGAGERCLGIHVEDQGQLRLETAGGEPVEPRHLVSAETANQPLVHQRGIRDAVAEDDCAVLDRRPDHPLDVVVA